MNDKLEMKYLQRAQEMWEGEGRPDGLAERHWLAAERGGTEETENAAVSRWAAPVKGNHVGTCHAAARAAEARPRRAAHGAARARGGGPPSGRAAGVGAAPPGARRAPAPDGRFFSRSAVPARAGREGFG